MGLMALAWRGDAFAKCLTKEMLGDKSGDAHGTTGSRNAAPGIEFRGERSRVLHRAGVRFLADDGLPYWGHFTHHLPNRTEEKYCGPDVPSDALWRDLCADPRMHT